MKHRRYKALLHSNYFLPALCLILHFLTYMPYFYSLNKNANGFWISSFILSPTIMLWLPYSFIPNFLGIFIIHQFYCKKDIRKYLKYYVLCIFIEHLQIGSDIFQVNLYEKDMSRIDYFFLFSRINYFDTAYQYILNVSVWFYIFHLGFLICHNKKNPNL